MRIQALLLSIPVATALLYACGDGDDSHRASDSDVVLEGDVTDETFVALKGSLDQRPPANDPTKAATLDSPEGGARLPRAQVPVFRWHLGTAAARPVQRSAGERWAGLRIAPPASPASKSPLFHELFGPVRSASAHGDPFNGTATYLVFSVSSGETLVRVLTGATSYTPSKEAWEKLLSANESITLTLVTAIFEQDRVVQDGGPFAGGSLTFTVAQ